MRESQIISILVCACVLGLVNIPSLVNCKLEAGSLRFKFSRSRFCPNSPHDGPPFRFHRDTQKCYMVGQTGPCGELMKFSMLDADFGECDCDLTKRCGRPLIYYPSKQRCYYVNSQGPCREGKWLVFGFDLKPLCKRNHCFDEETKSPSSEGEGRFWVLHQGKCHRTYSQGDCSKDEILFNMRTHYRPTCQQAAECGNMPIFQVVTCLPGQRMDIDGKCQRRYITLPRPNTTNVDPVEVPLKTTPYPLHCLFCNRKEPLDSESPHDY